MRVMIAGGTGFIGRHLSSLALERGWDVNLLVRNPASPAARDLDERGAHLVVGDITKAETLQAAFKTVRPDVYLHNAGWYELGIPHSKREAMRQVNVDGLANALAAAEGESIPRVIVTSSTTALGDTAGRLVEEGFQRTASASSWYERTLIEARKVADRYRERGFPLILGCPAQVIGPGDHSAYGHLFRLYLRRLLPPTVWGPDGAFSFVHVEDTARALLGLVEHGLAGGEYFIAGSVMTNREMLSTWAEELHRKARFVWLPSPLALAVGLAAAPLLRLAGQSAFISAEVVRSSYASFRYRADKIQQVTGVKLRDARRAWLDTIEAERSRSSAGKR